MSSNMGAVFPLAMDNWDEREFEAIQKVIASNRFTMGSYVEEFENSVSKKFGSRFAVMVNSGSSANLLMFTALKILDGHRQDVTKNIIVPAVSWSTSFTPSYYLGFELRFVDIELSHFGISPDLVERAIDENTIAILAVNLLGSPCDLKRLSDLAQKYKVALLEDNCESLGASLLNRHTGTFGLMATHSSFFSHHINTMEGGWVTTENEDLYDILRSLRAHGWTRGLPLDSKIRPLAKVDMFSSQFEFVLPGLNFRPLEIEAAIGLVQLDKFEEMLRIRQKNAAIFQDLFKNVKEIRIQVPLGESSWFAFGMVFTSNEQRNLIATALRSNGVECRPIVTGNFTRQTALDYIPHRIFSDLSVSDVLHDQGLYIGNHPILLEKELQFTHEIIAREIS